MSRLAQEIEMTGLRLAGIGAGIAAALALGGCTDYGRGYGSSGYDQGGYDAPPPGGYEQQGQGYGGGYAPGYDGGPGYDQGGGYEQAPYAGGYGGGYYGGGYDGFVDGPDYGYGYGWYDNFYYPGFGVFIYDRGGHRHPWRDSDRDYWRHHPRPHGDNPPRPGQGGWHGPNFPGRNNGQGSPNPGDGHGHWRGQDGSSGPDRGHGPAYSRRPMSLDQRLQQPLPPGQQAGAARTYLQDQASQGQAPNGQSFQRQAPQGHGFQGVPGGQPGSAPQPSGQWHTRQGGEMRVPAQGRPARAPRAAQDNANDGRHHHDHD